MNYPATITCKMCGVETPNPILEQTRGFVVFSTCQSCRDGLLGRFGRNARKSRVVAAPVIEEVTRDPVMPSRATEKSLLKTYLNEEWGWL